MSHSPRERLFRLCFRFSLLMFCCCMLANGFAQPYGPLKSRSDLYTYFNPADLNMPDGSIAVSDAIVYLSKSYFWGVFNEAGTSFLIRTPGNDEKVGLVLTGHQIYSYLGRDPVIGETIRFDSYIYMKYLGKDSMVNGIHYNRVSGYAAGYLDEGELKAYFRSTQTRSDIALVMIDRRKLPPVASYNELGYYLGNVPDSRTIFYTIGHSSLYPQLIADSLNLTNTYSEVLFMGGRGHYAVGQGSSGSPVINRPANAGDAWSVNGVISAIFLPYITPVSDVAYSDEIYTSSHNIIMSKINKLEPAIRQYCWKKSDSSQISNSHSYEQHETVDNSVNQVPYEAPQSISSINSFLSSTNAITQKVQYYGQQAALDAVSFYLRCKTLHVLNFPLPNKYPAAPYADLNWVVSLVGEEIEIGPGFEYQASDSSELNVATINGVGPSGAARRIGPSDKSVLSDNLFRRDDLFTVYPNPSPEGIFNIMSSLGGQYEIIITGMDGRVIYRSDFEGNLFRVQLSGVARGMYMLSVYMGYKQVFVQKIMY